MKSLIALGLAALLTFGTTNVATAGASPTGTSLYSGIIGIGGDPGDQGKVSIAITDTDRYTLRGKVAGIGFSKKGQLSESGTASDDFVLKLLGGIFKIPVHLEFAVTPDREQVSGFVSYEFRGEFTALNFTLYRSVPYTKASPAPQAGRHVIVFKPEEGGTTVLPGRGVATVKVSPTGLVKVTGSLADGAKISCGGRVSADGTFPILNVLYGRNGFVAGFAKFNNAGTPDLLSWVRATPQGLPVFNGKLVVEIHAYTPPAGGTPAIVFGNQENTAPLGLSGGGLTNFPPITIQVSNQNKVTVVGENESKLQLQLNKSTGLISGTILLEIGDTTQRRAVKLVILQDLDIARGFFVSPEPSGFADLGFLY